MYAEQLILLETELAVQPENNSKSAQEKECAELEAELASLDKELEALEEEERRQDERIEVAKQHRENILKEERLFWSEYNDQVKQSYLQQEHRQQMVEKNQSTSKQLTKL